MEMDKITDDNDHSLDFIYNQTVKKVTEDIETLNLNTAISQMMIFINECYKQEKVYKEYILNFIKMFSCFAPHLGEEMYHSLTGKDTITYEKWPTYDESKLQVNTVEVVVQVNGKMRGKLMIAKDSAKDVLEQEALKIDNVKANIDGKQIVKLIVIPNKIVNIVVK